MKSKPDKIKILDLTYTIEYVEKPSDVDNLKRRSLWGQIDYWTRTIRVYDNGRAVQDIWHTIWHEVFHGIIEGLEIDIPNDKEEHIIELLATGVNSVCFDNDLIKLEPGKRKTP